MSYLRVAFQKGNIMKYWRDGRVVDCDGLENRCTARYLGFESLSLRKQSKTDERKSKTNPVKSRFYGIFCCL